MDYGIDKPKRKKRPKTKMKQKGPKLQKGPKRRRRPKSTKTKSGKNRFFRFLDHRTKREADDFSEEYKSDNYIDGSFYTYTSEEYSEEIDIDDIDFGVDLPCSTNKECQVESIDLLRYSIASGIPVTLTRVKC